VEFLRTGSSLLIGLLPVLAFVVALVLLDSYKLVRPRRVVRMLVAGGIAALISLAIHWTLTEAAGLSRDHLSRYVAPVVEELLKAIPVILAINRRRVGFLVDSAIVGFAVGAGFAAVENIQYLLALGDLDVVLWLVRGFGTALMHGSVTATMAVLSKVVVDRHGTVRPPVFLPGLAVAIVLHSAFNHFFISPNLTAVLMLTLLPAIFVGLFYFSELRTRDWLGVGFDSDQELLHLIHSGQVSSSRIGAYLEELTGRFPPTVVADILCLLRLRLELSIQAKGILLMRQSGFPVEPDPEVEEKFAELRYLEHSIGPTGLLALAPFFHFSDRDLWQHHMLTGN
jgi:RsiW-degrading membrane proteinase PrsW (M82 family)